MRRADLQRRPADVAAMFDDVAPRYDTVNDVLSAGQDRLWRRVVTRRVGARTGLRVLDLAAGTGTSSQPLHRRGAHVVACDFSLGMLREGRRRRPWLPFVAGDALRLPFRDGSFDVVTISFGLRNVADVDRALQEMHRVTAVGGRVLVCEFSRPPLPVVRPAYEAYLTRVLPRIARRVASNGDAYGYLAESIVAWPDQPTLAGRLVAAGFSDVGWRNLSLGVVALHWGTRTAPEPRQTGA